MSDKNNIKTLPGANTDSMAAAVEKFKRELGIHKEYANLIAQMKRVYFDAYVCQGFTESEALELCKSYDK